MYLIVVSCNDNQLNIRPLFSRAWIIRNYLIAVCVWLRNNFKNLKGEIKNGVL